MKTPKWIVLVGLLVSGCSSSTEPPLPDLVAESALNFVRFSDGDFDLAERGGSFWAVKGESSEFILRYASTEPGEDGEKFLRFRVDQESLERRPDGTLFNEGDSVQISIRVDDAARFVFTMEPSGLVFNPNKPAELKVWYNRALQDLNNDGVIDEADAAVELELSLWRQENLGDAWERIGTVKIEGLQEAEAELAGFTGFALAS